MLDWTPTYLYLCVFSSSEIHHHAPNYISARSLIECRLTALLEYIHSFEIWGLQSINLGLLSANPFLFSGNDLSPKDDPALYLIKYGFVPCDSKISATFLRFMETGTTIFGDMLPFLQLGDCLCQSSFVMLFKFCDGVQMLVDLLQLFEVVFRHEVYQSLLDLGNIRL